MPKMANRSHREPHLRRYEAKGDRLNLSFGLYHHGDVELVLKVIPNLGPEAIPDGSA